jgi:hypothetical protein
MLFYLLWLPEYNHPLLWFWLVFYRLFLWGTIRIPSLVVTISNQSRDAFGNFLYGGWNAQQKKIFSNALTLTVKPLPDDLKAQLD